jgi:hypothetical protein
VLKLQREAAEQLLGLSIAFVRCRGGLEELKGGVGASLLEIVQRVQAALGSEGRHPERQEQGYEQ